MHVQLDVLNAARQCDIIVQSQVLSGGPRWSRWAPAPSPPRWNTCGQRFPPRGHHASRQHRRRSKSFLTQFPGRPGGGVVATLLQCKRSPSRTQQRGRKRKVISIDATVQCCRWLICIVVLDQIYPNIKLLSSKGKRQLKVYTNIQPSTVNTEKQKIKLNLNKQTQNYAYYISL